MLPLHRMREWLLVTANFQDRSSIGNVARALTRALHQHVGNSMSAWCITGQRPLGVPDSIVRPAAAPEVVVFIGFPNQARLILERHDRVVGVYVCESERISQAWVDSCNRHVAVVVPSDYCRRAFVASGVKVPVHVIPHGVESHFWAVRQKPRPERTGRLFGVVAMLNHYWRRKAPDIMLDVWRRWVEAHPQDRLQWRTGEFPDWTGQQVPGLEWCFGRIQDAELAKWYRSLDALILPSRGEGFGLPGLEALACGTPIIAPAHSGILEYVDQSRDWLAQPGPAEQIPTYEHADATVPGLTASALHAALAAWASEKRPDPVIAQAKWTWTAVAQPLASLLNAKRSVPVQRKVPMTLPSGPKFPSFSSELGVGLGSREETVYKADVSGLGQVVKALGASAGGLTGASGARVMVIPANPNECPNYRVVAGTGAAVPFVAWESSEWPEEWVRRFNSEAAAVLVPQAWAAEALQRSGCKVPVHVVPQAWQTWKRGDRKRPKKAGPVVVGFMGVPVQRKHLNELVLGLPKRCRLIGRLPWVPDGVALPTDERCSWLIGRMTDEEVQERFWSQVDVVVCPFAGEGYSMVPREAIAAGIPTIVTDIPAHADLACRKIAIAESEPAWFEWAKRNIGTWGVVTPEAISEALTEGIAQGLKWEQAQPAHSWPTTWSTIQQVMAERWATYVSAKDAGGGIERFAERLVRALPGLGLYRDMEVASRNAVRHRAMLWQLEYGLVDQGELDALRAYKKRYPWVQIVIIVHSACNGASEVRTNAVLRQVAAEGILLTDAQHQVFPNWKYLQHPWPEPGEYAPPPADRTFGTHGFVHQQKGYPALFALAREHKAKVLVCGLAQPKNATSLRVAESQLRPNLRPGDRWRNELCSDEALREEMSRCSLLLYPYSAFRNWQASGAVREAVRWGVPIVCSSEPYFADLPRDIFPRPDDIERALEHRREYQRRQAEYARAFGWSWFAGEVKALLERMEG